MQDYASEAEASIRKVENGWDANRTIRGAVPGQDEDIVLNNNNQSRW